MLQVRNCLGGFGGVEVVEARNGFASRWHQRLKIGHVKRYFIENQYDYLPHLVLDLVKSTSFAHKHFLFAMTLSLLEKKLYGMVLPNVERKK